MAAKALTFVEHSRVSDYGYPDGAHVMVLQNDTTQIHFIIYTGAPSTDFANAPNRSILLAPAAVYVKNGTIGLKDGSWVSAALS